MLTSITWEIFLTTIFGIISFYYAITSLLLYSGELKDWVAGKVTPVAQHPHDDPNSAHAPNEIMGRVNRSEIAVELRTSTLAEKDIAINSTDELQEPIQIPRQGSATPTDSVLVGSVADLLEEIKTLVQLINEYKSNKSEAQEFFHALFLRYPQLLNTSYQQAINLYIIDLTPEQFSFDLSLQEVTSWWSVTKPSNK